MAPNIDTFLIHDSSISLWRVNTETDQTMAFLHKLLRILYRDGWVIGRDPLVHKNHKAISRWHRAGRRGNLEMKAEAMGRHCEVKFYQNVANVENPHGGEYDFNILRRMPYLLRLRATYELNRLAEKATAMGFVDRTERIPKAAFSRLVHERKRTAVFHREIYSGDSFMRCRNGIDANGNQLYDGDWRRLSHNGRVIRGQVFYHISNMWWFIPNDSMMLNVACWELMEDCNGVYPRRMPKDPVKAIKANLDRCITDANFRKAESVLKAMARMGIAPNVKATCQ